MHVLTQKIVALRRQLVWRWRLTAACWIAATAIAVALVLGLADYWLHFKDTGLRIMATMALALAVAWVAYRAWYLPSQRRLLPLDVARRVERHFPQLQDSLASALEFLEQSEDDELAGSAQLRRLVVAEAQNTIETLPLEDVIERRPLRKAATALAVAAASMLVCVVIDPSGVQTALARLALPLGTTQWPRQHHLSFKSVPTRLAAGQALELELTDASASLPDDVRIEFGVARGGGREVISEAMTRAGEIMVARRENVQHSFAFRAEGGDDDTMPWNWVEVIEPPKLESLTIDVHPPAYTGLPPTRAERQLEVLAGSGIEVSGTTSKPIKGASILQDGLPPIPAAIVANAAGKDRHAFHIGPAEWIASKTGPYRLELVDDEGVAGIVGQWNLRVEPDTPPSISWQQPADDLFVLPRAVVPLAALVKDNLAIKQVDVMYERSDRSETELAAHPTEPTISLYRRPDKTVPSAATAAARGDTRVAKYDWDLTPLELPVGAQLKMQAEAQDYRPGTGRTAGPRKISIINADELETRLADRQTQIVRQLERALAIERATREDVRRIEIQQHDAGMLTLADRNTLQSAELNQRHAGKVLIDPAEGIPPLIESVLTEIEINRLENSATRETMGRLAAELQRLAQRPLSVAERELTSARKTMETSQARAADAASATHTAMDAKSSESLSQSFATTAAAQDDVIVTLERLVGELSSRADSRRFARLIAELRQDQISHEKAARTEIGLETLRLAAGELSRAQRASLNKAAASENTIAGRFDKIEQGLNGLAQQLTADTDPAAGTISDAVELSWQLNIGLDMRQTTSDFRENRVGQALDRETQIAVNLQKLLSALRNESERKPQDLANKLRDAEKQLAALREQTAALQQQTANTEKNPAAANEQQRAQLSARQQQTRQGIEKLARQLERLQATEAGKSTQSAARQLDNRDADEKPPAAEKPSSSSQVKKAEQNLKQAAEQLAQRRQQAEDDLALEFVRRFQTELTQMVERQQRVLKKTTELDELRKQSATLTPDQGKQLANLADEERQLAQMSKEHGELLTGLGAVRVSLEESERRLLAASKLLDDQQSGSLTQSAEQLALSRLEAMLQAFAQTASDSTPKPNAPPPPPGAGAQNNQPQLQRRPTFELLQAKMLRMLQTDVNERTQQYQQRLAEAKPAEIAQLQQEAQELAAEQGRLAELVQEMITRDNEQQQEPPK